MKFGNLSVGAGGAVIALLASAAAQAAVVDVNGVCVSGNPCPGGSVLPYHGSYSTTFSALFSVNGDPYSITGSFTTTSPSYILFDQPFRITYLGSAPTAGLDTIAVAGTELYDEPFGTGVLGFSTGLYGYFGPGVSAGSYVTFYNTVNGTTLPLGPYYAPDVIYSGSVLNYAQNTSPLPDTFGYTLNFAAGTTHGAQIAIDEPLSLVPEPATWAMMLMGLGGLGAAMRGARRGRLSRAG